eukprot:5453385-Amphidinium_carterae.1
MLSCALLISTSVKLHGLGGCRSLKVCFPACRGEWEDHSGGKGLGYDDSNGHHRAGPEEHAHTPPSKAECTKLQRMFPDVLTVSPKQRKSA